MDFDSLYRGYIDIVYNFLIQRLRDKHLVEDIVHETFLSIYKSRDSMPSSEKLKSWILTIAYRRMVDELRKQDPNTQPYCHKIKYKGNKELNEENIVLTQIMEKLKPENRQILYGIYHLGLSCNELGEIMGMPEGTIKSRAYYTRQKLRNELEKG